MATTSENQTSQNTWQRLKEQMSQGYTPYVLVTAYAVIIPLLSILNMMADPRPSLYGDVLFVLFLGTFLVLHKAPVSTTYKVTVGVLVLTLVMPYFGTFNQFYMDVITQVGMFIVLALGLNIVVGFAGLLDLGYIAFYAVGAYTWAIFSTPQAGEMLPQMTGVFPLSAEWFFIFMPLTLVIGAITGVLLGLPVLRLRGDYLAIVTLGFGEVIRVLATNLDKPVNITNGAQGIKSIGAPPLFLQPLFDLFGLELNRAQTSQLHFYVLVWAVVGLMLVVVVRLTTSRIGRAWTAIREDETAALAMGVPLVRMKLLAFATGASFAGVMGMIFAAKQTFINPPTFDLIRSINILAMVILGGMGSVPGAVLGATLVTLLNLQLLPRITTELDQFQLPAALDPAQYQRMIFGLLLIVMTIFRPQGLLPEDRRKLELSGDDDEEVPLGEEGEQETAAVDDAPPDKPDTTDDNKT
jgi:branched-chain amino acid transport system permease protein